MTLAMRALGRSGLVTPPLVLGGNVFGWTADRTASFAVLDAFVAGGGRMIDTADVYSAWAPGHQGGESESMIGEWLRARGQPDVMIATKTGMKLGEGDDGLAADRIERACEASLRRLGRDHIDLYFAHRDDVSVPLADSLEAFDRLVKAGKVRAIAASNYQAARLDEALDLSLAHDWARYEVLQPLYNLLERDQFEGALQQLCIDREIGVVPYYGLAAGFLTGKYRNEGDLAGKTRAAVVKKYATADGFALIDTLDQVAAEVGASPGEVALAWLASRPGVTAPIASATSVAQAEELVRAMSLTLSSNQITTLDEAGDRYAQASRSAS